VASNQHKALLDLYGMNPGDTRQ